MSGGGGDDGKSEPGHGGVGGAEDLDVGAEGGPGGRVGGAEEGESGSADGSSEVGDAGVVAQVEAGLREQGVGSRLLDEVCARFSSAGVDTVRTMIARSNRLVMSFFRSRGLSAGPYVQLEMRLDELPGPPREP